MTMPRSPLPLTKLATLALGASLTACGIVKIESPGAKDPSAASSTSTDPSTTTPSSKPSVADLEARLQSILKEADAPTAIEKLGALRQDLLERRKAAKDAAEKTQRTHPSPHDRTLVLGVEGRTLLRRIHHERARLYTNTNRPAQALAEMAVLGGFDDSATLLECGGDEAVCKTVREDLEKRYPGICGPNGCPGVAEIHWSQAGYALLQVRISGVKKTANGWLVTGAEFGPDTFQRCVSSFQTDKVLAIKGNRVEVERTTWCKKLETEHRRGYRFTYALTDAPFAPTVGGQMLLLGDPTKLRVGQRGGTDMTQIDKPILLELRVGKGDGGVSTSPDGDDGRVFRHNQSVPPQLVDADLYWRPAAR